MSSTPEPDEVLALLDRAKELNREKRPMDALAIYAQLLQRLEYQVGDDLRTEIAAVTGTAFSASHPLAIGAREGDEVLRRMLGGLSMALFRLERYDAAILGWDQVISHFADSDDPETRPYVVRALYMKTAAFVRLKQFDDFVVALDAATAFAKDIGDPWMAFMVAAGMLLRARSLGADGRIADQPLMYQDILDRFAQSDDPKLKRLVQAAFLMKAEALTELGQIEHADQTFAQFLTWAARDTPGEVVELNPPPELGQGLLVYVALRGAAEQGAVGDVRETAQAVVNLDRALSVLSDSDKPTALRRKLDCLVSKARLFQRVGEHEGAMESLDVARKVYQTLPEAARDARSLGQVIHALLLKAISISAVDPSRAYSLADSVDAVLGDVVSASQADAVNQARPPSEEELASLLAEAHAAHVWTELATSGDDPESLALMTEKALELYRMTGASLSQSRDDPDTPASVAAMLLRNLGDSYALLSRSWDGAQRQALPLSSSLLTEFALRRGGVVDWAAELGHPIELSEPDDLAESLLESQEEESSDHAPDLEAAFVASVTHYEMLRRIAESARGRAALGIVELRRFAIDRIAAADRIGPWIGMHEQDAIGIGLVGMFIAQALYVATHEMLAPDSEVFPSHEVLRAVLESTEAFDWLEEHDVYLPSWLTDSAT